MTGAPRKGLPEEPQEPAGGRRGGTAGPSATLAGILNVTPDSFSDGGRFLDPSAAVAHGVELARQGAAIIDVGGESTRPGAEPVGAQEELRRVIGVIEGLAAAQTGATISIDSSKLEVARAALDAGATFVNDVTAFRAAPALAQLVAERGARCCLTHMQGEPRTMQDAPSYTDVVSEVRDFLAERAAFAEAAGIPPERIVIDPGIGFGKTVEHNLELLAKLDRIVELGYAVMVGTSRKSFLGRLTGRGEDERLAATVATNVLAFLRGASIFRVHDVAAVGDALAVVAATVTRR